MTKKKRMGLIISLILILFFIYAVALYFFGATYPFYNSIKRDEFAIPGLETSFVPQGFAYDEQTSTFFIGGYMSDGSASRIYVLSQNGGREPKYVCFLHQDKTHSGHMGGLAVYQDYIFVASDGYVYRISKNQILSAQNESQINVLDCFKTENGADCLSIYDNKLFVGEFYKAGKYETKQEHQINIKAGEINKALAYCYALDLTKPYGISSTTPEFGLSLPNQTQGFDFMQDKIVVSTSYSIPDSKILVYDNPLIDMYKQEITLFEKIFPVYILSSSNIQKEITAPSMSEEIVVKDNRVYILYESACSKYRLVNRTRTKVVHSIKI